MALFSAVTWGSTVVQGFVVAAIVYREVGSGAFGVWATIGALRGIVLLLDGGVATGVNRDVALAREGDGVAAGRVRAAWGLYAVLAALMLGLGVVGAALPGAMLGLEGVATAAASATMFVLCLDAAFALAAGPLPAILRGSQRFDALAAMTFVSSAFAVGLLFWLVPAYGIVGAAWSLVIGRVVGTGAAAFWMKARGLLRIGRTANAASTVLPSGLPAESCAVTPARAADRSEASRGLAPVDESVSQSSGDATRSSIKALIAFAFPLWVVAVGEQLGLLSDVPIVGAFFGEDSASAFALGARLPAAGAGLLFAIVAASFPKVVTETPLRQKRLTSSLLCMACVLAGAGFGFAALNAHGLLKLWVDDAPALAVNVLWIYALAWGLNAPAHVLASVAIALGKHRVLAWLVLVESIVNIGLSVLLVAFTSVGAVGPAWATLATLFVSNVVILPILLVPRLGLLPSMVLGPAVYGLGFGVVAAWLATWFGQGLGDGIAAWLSSMGFATPWLSLLVGGAALLVFVGVILDLTVRGNSLLVRWARITRRGGWRVRIEQAREIRAERKRLEELRKTPIVWTKEEPPLVSVRIAIYNRGPLVAERAIASALAQTHENLEVLVVGDCCDEATAAAVRAVDDPRLRFVNLPERGKYPDDPRMRWMVAGAPPMNYAVTDMMRGEWIAPLDDDDEFTRDHVATLLEACRERELDFAYGLSGMEQDDGSWSQCGAWPPRRGGIVHAAVLYSRRISLLLSLDSWRVDEPADWNLWSRMQRAGVRMGFVDKIVTKHYAEMREVAEVEPFWLGGVLVSDIPLESAADVADAAEPATISG